VTEQAPISVFASKGRSAGEGCNPRRFTRACHSRLAFAPEEVDFEVLGFHRKTGRGMRGEGLDQKKRDKNGGSEERIRLLYRAVNRIVFLHGEKPMKKFGQRILVFLNGEDGPTAVEYAVMLALIILVCLAAITSLGTNANASFASTSNALAPS
jgi:pilus assembly protein Flp/PilA